MIDRYHLRYFLAVVDTGNFSRAAAACNVAQPTLSVAIIVLLAGMAAFAGIHQATMPQTRVETADPSTLHVTGEFIESNLGSAIEPDGSVTVRALGQQYSFVPQCVVVPTGTLGRMDRSGACTICGP